MTTYSIPTHIEIGPQSIEKLPELLKETGKRVLLVHGHRPVEDGLVQKVRRILNEAGFPHSNMGQILPNPKYGSVKRGIKIARKDHCDIILALGGGSTLQCAKAIALGLNYQGDVWDFWTGKKTPDHVSPVASILTNPASGAELNDGCTLVRKGEQKTIHNEKLECRFAILDPELSVLPFYPTMCQSFDLFVHLFSAALHDSDCPLDLDLMLMKELFSCTEKLETNLQDIEARNSLFWVGLMSHSLIQAPSSDCAELADKMAFRYSLTSGSAASALFPAWCDQVLKDNPKRLAEIGQRVFEDPDLDAGKTIQKFRDKIEKMEMALSIPQTGLVVDNDELMKLADNRIQKEMLLASNARNEKKKKSADQTDVNALPEPSSSESSSETKPDQPTHEAPMHKDPLEFVS